MSPAVPQQVPPMSPRLLRDQPATEYMSLHSPLSPFHTTPKRSAPPTPLTLQPEYVERVRESCEGCCVERIGGGFIVVGVSDGEGLCKLCHRPIDFDAQTQENLNQLRAKGLATAAKLDFEAIADKHSIPTPPTYTPATAPTPAPAMPASLRSPAAKSSPVQKLPPRDLAPLSPLAPPTPPPLLPPISRESPVPKSRHAFKILPPIHDPTPDTETPVNQAEAVEQASDEIIVDVDKPVHASPPVIATESSSQSIVTQPTQPPLIPQPTPPLLPQPTPPKMPKTRKLVIKTDAVVAVPTPARHDLPIQSIGDDTSLPSNGAQAALNSIETSFSLETLSSAYSLSESDVDATPPVARTAIERTEAKLRRLRAMPSKCMP